MENDELTCQTCNRPSGYDNSPRSQYDPETDQCYRCAFADESTNNLMHWAREQAAEEVFAGGGYDLDEEAVNDMDAAGLADILENISSRDGDEETWAKALAAEIRERAQQQKEAV